MQGGKLSLILGLLLVVAAQSSWIAGKKVHEAIAGVNDIPIDFSSLTVTVHTPTHAFFSSSAADAAAVSAQLDAQLQSHGVRENEAKHIAEWAGASGSYASRAFEFKYVDEVGQLLVKQVLCNRQVVDGVITVTTSVSSALGTCPVAARKHVHHERIVKKRVVGIRVKRSVERWTTQEPRGLTRAEIDRLVDLMAAKVHEAISASAPPTLKAVAGEFDNYGLEGDDDDDPPQLNDVERAKEIVMGAVEGFASDFPDITQCIHDGVVIEKEVVAIVNLLRDRKAENVKKGLEQVAQMIAQQIGPMLQDCKHAQASVEKIVAALELLAHPREFIFHVGRDLKVNGKDILREIIDAISAVDMQQWRFFGFYIGKAAGKLIVGRQLNDVERAKEIILGAVEGFASDFPDITQCIRDGIVIEKEVMEIVKLLRDHKAENVKEGLKALAEMIHQQIGPMLTDCAHASASVKKILAAFALMAHPAQFAFHVGKDLVVNGKDILREIIDAIGAYDMEQWHFFGFFVGKAAGKLIVGDQYKNTNKFGLSSEASEAGVLRAGDGGSFVAFHSNEHHQDYRLNWYEKTELTLHADGKASLINDSYGDDDRSDACFFGGMWRYEGVWEERDGKVHVHFTSRAGCQNSMFAPKFAFTACDVRMVVQKTGSGGAVIESQNGVECVFTTLDNVAGREKRG